jgi:hypothetical protein
MEPKVGNFEGLWYKFRPLGTAPETISEDSENVDNGETHTHALDIHNAVTVDVNSQSVLSITPEQVISIALPPNSFPDTITSNTINEINGTFHTHKLESISASNVFNGNSIKYGALYNWYAATDVRNICSEG